MTRRPISATVYVKAAMCEVCHEREANETLWNFDTCVMTNICYECSDAGKRPASRTTPGEEEARRDE